MYIIKLLESYKGKKMRTRERKRVPRERKRVQEGKYNPLDNNQVRDCKTI